MNTSLSIPSTPFLVGLKYTVKCKGKENKSVSEGELINHKKIKKEYFSNIEYNDGSLQIFHVAPAVNKLRKALVYNQKLERTQAENQLNSRTNLAASIVRLMIFHHSNWIVYLALRLLSACSQPLGTEIAAQKLIINKYDTAIGDLALCDKVESLLKQRTDLLVSYLKINNLNLVETASTMTKVEIASQLTSNDSKLVNIASELTNIESRLSILVGDLEILHNKALSLFKNKGRTESEKETLRPDRDELMIKIRSLLKPLEENRPA